MSVRFEIKDQLARLLAQEDLIVEHKNVETASFDVDRRVLVLPLWERASSEVYDMLVGHEVGHALYTPNEDFSALKAPKCYLNVVEDARIEKLIKRRYRGLGKYFIRAYKELNEQDFFGTKESDLTKFSFIDRINLFFKGNDEIRFTDKETVYVDRVASIMTFEEACRLAEEIYEFAKEEKENQEQLPDVNLNTENKSGSVGTSQESEESDDYDSEEPQPGESYGGTADKSESGFDSPGDHSSYNEGVTVDNFDQKVESLRSNSRIDTRYVQIPQVNLNTVVIQNQEVWKVHDEERKILAERDADHGYQYDRTAYHRDEYKRFKKSAQKEVSYLIKEFECRKSATSYARASTSRTGVLDTSKLHTYKFNEDLFKKITVLPDGKNHGLIFILDWSGSMSNILKDTVKQLLNLVWFCRKVNIPFEVFAFTNDWLINGDRMPCVYPSDSIHQKFNVNDLVVSSGFSLMTFLSSQTSAKDFEYQCENLFVLSCSQDGMRQLGLSGTPLNEALITLHQLIPDFKKRFGVEKLNTIILTDGEAQYIPYFVEFQRKDGKIVQGFNNIDSYTCLRDRKLGRVYQICDRYFGLTHTILTNLTERFSDVNFIGIRLASGSELRRFLDRHLSLSDINDVMLKWKKDKSVAIDNMGYTKFFAMSSQSLSNDTDFQVQEDASKSQIKSAFIKSLNSKKLNKKVLSQFMELVA